MKRFGMRAVALLALIVAVGLLHGPQPAVAQDDQQTGWLEGTILTPEGKTLGDVRNNSFSSVSVTGKQEGGSGKFEVRADRKSGGLWVVRDLQPGVYEVKVPMQWSGDDVYRPVRIFSVMVKPGVRTVLRITMHAGETLDEIGKPAVATQNVVIISTELERLKAEIAELKKQVGELKKK